MDDIPTIDASRLEEAATLAVLERACREWGFFHVVHHGIPADLTRSLRREMRAFFAQPCAAKRALSRTADDPWGYFDRELTKNTRDWKEIFDLGPQDEGGRRPRWPAALPGFEPALCAFYAACEGLAFELLAAISRNLGTPPGHLARAFRPVHSSFLRLNHYPVCPEPARPDGASTPSRGFLGVNHHTDAGALTLLLQDDEPGLEVLRDGRWHLVEPRRDTLVVNIGDIVQVWSNDRYRASLHRVRANAARERFSAPFFFCPAYRVDYAPLPTTVDARHPSRYRPINWGEFRRLRADGDYRDCGEEVQIHHYRMQEGS